MAKIYAELIKKGKKAIDDVPENLREAVQALLVELGYCEPSIFKTMKSGDVK